MLTENQKILLFYCLEAVERTLCSDGDEIDYNPREYQLQIEELRKISGNNLVELEKIIDKTLSDLC